MIITHWQTETCTDSGGGRSGSVGHINPVDQQKQDLKEEPEDEGYVCELKPHNTAYYHPPSGTVYPGYSHHTHTHTCLNLGTAGHH